jgi:hypothetical protein
VEAQAFELHPLFEVHHLVEVPVAVVVQTHDLV